MERVEQPYLNQGALELLCNPRLLKISDKAFDTRLILYSSELNGEFERQPCPPCIMRYKN
jgi:hypothetical protein